MSNSFNMQKYSKHLLHIGVFLGLEETTVKKIS